MVVRKQYAHFQQMSAGEFGIRTLLLGLLMVSWMGPIGVAAVIEIESTALAIGAMMLLLLTMGVGTYVSIEIVQYLIERWDIDLEK